MNAEEVDTEEQVLCVRRYTSVTSARDKFKLDEVTEQNKKRASSMSSPVVLVE